MPRRESDLARAQRIISIRRYQWRGGHLNQLILRIIRIRCDLPGPFMRFLGQIAIGIVTIPEITVFEQSIGSIVRVESGEMRAEPVADQILGKAFGGIRGLRMGGLIQVIQEIVDGMELLSDIGNHGASVNKRLDPK